jgi:predicted MFS family arabinose efflux permease
MALGGVAVDTPLLMAQRLLAGIASAIMFVAGGLLAARLGMLDGPRAGLLLGIYYGGTGLGIVVSALVVPALLEVTSSQVHGWQKAWWALAGVCLVASLALVQTCKRLDALPAPAASASDPNRQFEWHAFGYGLGAYALFGVGYIGYMTFVVALLRSQGASTQEVTVFYAALGVAVMASSRIWAGVLTRYRGGQPLALLSALLGLATVLPAVTQHPVGVLGSGLLFGGVFLSVVASTTALVRHNLPPSAWAQGISAFTMVFAAGQIAGPTMVGWIADGPGGLGRGLVVSAVALWAGALLAIRQKALT